jgi:hypothetical protein
LTFKLIWESLKKFHKAKEVAALANSEGCIVKLQGIPTTLTSYGFTKSPANDNKENNKMILAYFS